LRIGFEVRVTVAPDPANGSDAGAEVNVVMSRSHQRSLGLTEGSRVWLSPAPAADLAATSH
jgi:sulfate/thiosulfate transport system ATP-binding protein